MGTEKMTTIPEQALHQRMAVSERAAVGRRVLDELVGLLPPTGAAFPIQERAKWLRAAEAVLTLTHGVEGRISIEVIQDEIVIRVMVPSP
jgi:hypothetical protein